MNKKEGFISSVSGLLIGFFSGLVGVGGGEYRAPVLLYLLNLSAKFAIAANLLIGIFSVSASTIMRYSQILDKNLLLVAGIFSVTSIIGSYLGAKYTKKFDDKILVRILGILLIIVAIKVFFESDKTQSGIFVLNTPPILLSLLFGFIIGGISGFLGIAGGEFRIPALILIFGIPIKIAGAANLLISIPTVAVGFAKHHHNGHVTKDSKKIAIFMGIFTVIGAIIGAKMAHLVTDNFLFITLSIIMLIAGLKMTIKP